jgi:PTH1 family peptidyl-tRNA hydrolase
MVKRSGGTAGHRGLESIVRVLGTDRFPRIRMGVGRPHPDVDPVEWVLEEFRRSERKEVEEMVVRAAEAAECYVRDGLETAMNRHNRWPI